jgi:hypothetical protein
LLGVPRMVEKLPQDIAREREALLATLKREQPLFNALSSQYRGAVGDTTTLVGSLTDFADTSQQTLAEFNELVKTINKDGRPFDIREYGATLDKLTAALQQADRLAGTGLAVAQTAQPQSLTELMKADRSRRRHWPRESSIQHSGAASRSWLSSLPCSPSIVCSAC